MEKINIGIISPGRIANKMAYTIINTPGFFPYSVASRDINHAKDFQDKYGFKYIYDDIEKMLSDPKLDLVYIASPHSIHLEQLKLCLKYKKHVICEKSLTTSFKDSEYIMTAFNDANLYLTEALWTSFMPYNKVLNNLLYKDKVIGDIKSMYSSFICEGISVPRIYKRELGGGAALDIGIYPISMILRALGFNYLDIKINKHEFYNDVDVDDEIEIIYPNNIKAIARFSVLEDKNENTVIYGTKGRIEIDSPTCPNHLYIYDNDNILIKDIAFDHKLGGFEYELIESGECIKNNIINAPSWPKDKTLIVSSILDNLFNK